MIFTDSKLTQRAHPALGLSLSPGEGKIPHSQEASCCPGHTSIQKCQHHSIIPLMPCQPLAQWLPINPEPPGMGRWPVYQMHLGHHPQSFIMMGLFTEDFDIPFEMTNKWPGQKSGGYSIAGATGSAARMLHWLGTQDRIPSGTGTVLPLQAVSGCLCFPGHQMPAGWVLVLTGIRHVGKTNPNLSSPLPHPSW